jgi:5-methylcytosine-specific restriction endonuclease McrA
MHTRTLVLTSWYFPHKIVSWEAAVTLVYLDKVDVVVTYDEEIRSPSTTIKTPAVVRLKKKTAAMKRGVKFSRMNVYVRDAFTCVYCKKTLAISHLTYDHVIPRAQGGRTEWENIVTACYGCNARKGNRTPDQSGMFPVRAPYKPSTLPLLPPFIDTSSAPIEWRDFCAKLPRPSLA